MIADASQGVTTQNFDLGDPGRQSWDLQLPPWVFGKNEWQGDSSDLMRLVANKHPRSRVAQFTTAMDSVQIGFYGYMKLAYPPGGACLNLAIDWNQQMVGTLQSNAAHVPNFRYYLADGSFHTLLRSPLFYTEDSAGSTYSNWVEGMLKNRGRQSGLPVMQ